jgi:SEC-C motif
VAFALLSVLWVSFGSLYGHMLAAIVRPMAPFIEHARGTRYVFEHDHLVVYRPVRLLREGVVRDRGYVIWRPLEHYGLPLLAALLVATPIWTWRGRWRALALGLGLLTLVEILTCLITIEASRLWPIPTPSGDLIPSPGSPVREAGFTAAAAFLEVMGRALFPIAIYLVVLILVREPQPGHGVVPRNALCSCGSGLKFKRCCGR